jgi:hypothetical protein
MFDPRVDSIISELKRLNQHFCKKVKCCLGISPQGDSNLVLNQQGDWVPTGSTADVETILFKTITPTVVTGKTVENSIYSIPLPIDGYNYVIELYSNAHIVTYPGFTQNHRIRCGTYLAPIDGTTGANAIGNQTLIFNNQGTTNGAPVYIDRKFIFKGGVSGTIFGVQTGVTEVWNTVTPTTLMSANFTTQHYLYVCFSAMNSGVFQHNFITIKLIKI